MKHTHTSMHRRGTSPAKSHAQTTRAKQALTLADKSAWAAPWAARTWSGHASVHGTHAQRHSDPEQPIGSGKLPYLNIMISKRPLPLQAPFLARWRVLLPPSSQDVRCHMEHAPYLARPRMCCPLRGIHCRTREELIKESATALLLRGVGRTR